MLAIKEIYVGEWQIMVTKDEGGEDTANVLSPLPRRLAWSGSSNATGLLWIGQDRYFKINKHAVSGGNMDISPNVHDNE